MRRTILSCIIFLFLFTVSFAQYPWTTTSVCVKDGCTSYLRQQSFFGGRGWELTIGCDDGTGGRWSGSGAWSGSFSGCTYFYQV